MQVPTGSESFRKLNKHLFPSNGPWEPQECPALSHGCLGSDLDGLGHGSTPKTAKSVPKRIRQGSKPVLNKLESEFYQELLKSYAKDRIYCQSLNFRLANGVRLLPDFVVIDPLKVISETGIICFECKGKYAWEDSLVKIKVAAQQYPHFTWILVWKDQQGKWCEQRVLA